MVYKVDVKHSRFFLREVDILQGLSDRHVDRIAALCEERRFSAGEQLAVQNQLGKWLYVIRRGNLTATTGSGNSTIVVRTVGEHEAFPVAVLFEPPILLTTATAATDGEAFAIPRVGLLELCELEPRIGLHIFKAASRILMTRYRHMLQKVDELVGPEGHIDRSHRGGAL